jgi:hypothetical protein
VIESGMSRCHVPKVVFSACFERIIVIEVKNRINKTAAARKKNTLRFVKPFTSPR